LQLLGTLEDPRQRLRLKRTLLATLGGLVHTGLCGLGLALGFFRGGPALFALILGLSWLVHLAFVALIVSGANRRYRDPSLTLAQITWATLSVMVTVYFFDQMRMVLLMYYLLVMVFGAFRLRWGGFAYTTGLAVAAYGVVIWLLAHLHPRSLHLELELVRWAGFAITLSCFSLVGGELSRLRRWVGLQNRDLKQAVAKIQELAITDELTGLYNRRHILEILEQQRGMARRGGHRFVVGFADLDHFKRLNDRLGHQAGDHALQEVARLAVASTRGVDYVARFGGEEFILVLVQTGLPEAELVAERIRAGVAASGLGREKGGEALTISLGLAQHEPGEPVEETLARADRALYRAKQAGRNRVEAAPSAGEAQTVEASHG
jgi:diguanylate cyclase (GGDEF)-like protein